MDRSTRIIILSVFVALALWRLVRYMRTGLERRTQAAIPSTSGVAPVPAAAPLSPTTGAALRPASALAAFLVWVAGNAAVLASLFGLPALDAVPVILRLVAAVFANFYLIRLARAAAHRIGTRGDSGSAPGAGKPFP